MFCDWYNLNPIGHQNIKVNRIQTDRSILLKDYSKFHVDNKWLSSLTKVELNVSTTCRSTKLFRYCFSKNFTSVVKYVAKLIRHKRKRLLQNELLWEKTGFSESFTVYTTIYSSRLLKWACLYVHYSQLVPDNFPLNVNKITI